MNWVNVSNNVVYFAFFVLKIYDDLCFCGLGTDQLCR